MVGGLEIGVAKDSAEQSCQQIILAEIQIICTVDRLFVMLKPAILQLFSTWK
jgi:hypothetical protein